MWARFFHKAQNNNNITNNSKHIIQNTEKKIWSVAGGKGGTGKSIIASSIAVQLAKRGKRVVIIDADLGSGNLHTYLGVTPRMVTLADFLKNRTTRLADTLANTQYENLYLISDTNEVLGLANITQEMTDEMIRQIHELDFEYIIIDVGAGSSNANLDFFLISNQGLVIATPDPASVENVYRFIRSCLNRKLIYKFENTPYKPLLDKVADPKDAGAGGTYSIYEMVEDVYQHDSSLAEDMVEEIMQFKPRLIMNQVRSQGDIQVGESVRDVTRKYLGIHLSYIGYVTYDDHIKLSAQKRAPLFQEYPNSGAAVCIRNIVNRFLG